MLRHLHVKLSDCSTDDRTYCENFAQTSNDDFKQGCEYVCPGSTSKQTSSSNSSKTTITVVVVVLVVVAIIAAILVVVILYLKELACFKQNDATSSTYQMQTSQKT